MDAANFVSRPVQTKRDIWCLLNSVQAAACQTRPLWVSNTAVMSVDQTQFIGYDGYSRVGIRKGHYHPVWVLMETNKMSATMCHLSVLCFTFFEHLSVLFRVMCDMLCPLHLYRSSSCRSASRWTAKPEASAAVWCPLKGARVKSQWTLKFPSLRGTKHNAALIIIVISGDWNLFFLHVTAMF